MEFVYSVDDGVGGVDDSGGLFEFDVEGVVLEFFVGIVDVGQVCADCGLVAPGYFGSCVVDVEPSPRLKPGDSHLKLPTSQKRCRIYAIINGRVETSP